MSETTRYKFSPINRNTFPAPIPFIVDETHIPTNQKIIVFLPHSDDGRYIGSSLYLLNKVNDVNIVIMSPGYHGVDGDDSKQKKTEQRWSETECWAECLGYKKEQLIDFRADKTYETQRINKSDKEKLYWMISCKKPTLILIPHISDTAQSMTYNTRKMVINALTAWLTNQHRPNNRNKRSVLVFEYPTNHVPLLPPSDKNFIMKFSNPSMADIKHEANKSHESQSTSGFDSTEKMIEAIGSVTDADTLHQVHKHRKYARYISGVRVDPNRSRGEHFGVTKLSIVGPSHFHITEERIKFPLNKKDSKKWFKNKL